MRKIALFFLMLCTFMLPCGLLSCRVFSDHVKQEMPSKKKVKKNYYAAPFESIEVNGVANLSFTQSDKVEIEVTGPENYLPFVIIESRNGVLHVNTRRIGNKRIGKGLEVKISAPVLNRLSNKGVGDVRINSSLKSPSMSIYNAGVGNVRVEHLECKELNVNNSGVGDLVMSGKVDRVQYKASGVGDIRARDLHAKDAVLNHSGVGDITCHASETIRITIKGVGNVTYYGHPEVLSLSKSGVGSLNSR